MNKSKEEFKHLIYDLVRGTRNVKEYPVEESKYVKNEFENGMYCSNAYEEVYNANERLCVRLEKDEDEDVECIISNLLGIAEFVSMKMYDYGELYAYRYVDTNKDKLIYFYDNLPDDKKVKFMKLLKSLEKVLIV